MRPWVESVSAQQVLVAACHGKCALKRRPVQAGMNGAGCCKRIDTPVASRVAVATSHATAASAHLGVVRRARLAKTEGAKTVVVRRTSAASDSPLSGPFLFCLIANTLVP